MREFRSLLFSPCREKKENHLVVFIVHPDHTRKDRIDSVVEGRKASLCLVSDKTAENVRELAMLYTQNKTVVNIPGVNGGWG